MPPHPIYQKPELRDIFGDALRPGGLDITKEALALADFSPGAKIADLGCGAGASLKLLTALGFEAIGLDCSPALLKEAKSKGKALEGDFHHLPWPDGYFDGLLCECALSLAADPGRVLRESFRVLKNKGWLIISDLVLIDDEKSGPAGENAAAGAPPSCAAAARPAGQLAALIRRSGFELVHNIDRTGALNSLAAQMVWRLGTADEMKRIFGLNCKSGCGPPRHAYSLILSRKESR